MRRALPLFAGLLLAGCELTPPCTKVAKAICDVGDEGDSCAFVLGLARNDQASQAVCRRLVPAALNLAAYRGDPAVQSVWRAARLELGSIGFLTNARAGRIEEKIKAFGGEGGRIVDSALRISEESERARTEAADAVLKNAGE